MKPANTPLAHVDLGTSALVWPEFEPITISLASPDDRGAVAYYFDTLVPGAPSHEAVRRQVSRAACQYLLAMIHRNSLQLVRGPYLVEAPDSDSVVTSCRMVRAVAWVEEFDLVVEPEPTYFVMVNGVTVESTGCTRSGGYLTYTDVAILAGLDPEMNPTMTFRNGQLRQHGTLSRGDQVQIRQRGTAFNVAYTGAA